MKRRGFTLVELLVVISIIGMLMALLLPAVNMAMEAARRGRCVNRLKNMSLAVKSHQASKGCYPGWRGDVFGSGVNASWMVHILPFLERSDLYDAWGGSAGGPANIDCQAYVEVAVCPSDSGRSEDPADFPLSYVANVGIAQQGLQHSLDGSTNPHNIRGVDNRNVGVFVDRYASPNVKSGDDTITDGLSNTIMFSENLQASNWGATGANGLGFIWSQHNNPPTDGSVTCTGWDDGNGSPPTYEAPLRVNKGDTLSKGLGTRTARPSSEHPGVVVAALCDGSVRVLNEEIDPDEYRHAMTPNSKKSYLPGTFKGFEPN